LKPQLNKRHYKAPAYNALDETPPRPKPARPASSAPKTAPEAKPFTPMYIPTF
jgi:hypothetical protein